ncbi:hypothetical protein [Streptomyces sp. NPDC004014]
MWRREVLRLDGASEVAVEAARAASRVTRSAVTGPLVAVSVLGQSLAGPARQAALAAAFALRDATDHTAPAARREAAMAATDELVAAAGRAMS